MIEQEFKRQQDLLYFIYEYGMEFKSAFTELTGVAPYRYNRVEARKLIRHVLNKFVSGNERVHPIYLLEPLVLRNLIDELKKEPDFEKNMPPGPCVI